jgi:hypothetical protein
MSRSYPRQAVSHPSHVEVWSTGELGLDNVAGLRVFRSVRNLVSELEIEIRSEGSTSATTR